jgi:site-specific recombinase XerD
MEDLLTHWVSVGYSAAAAKAMFSSWALSTRKQYDSSLQKWATWCSTTGVLRSAPTIPQITNFLGELFRAGHSYNSLMVNRAAITSYLRVLNPATDYGAADSLTRFMKGVFRDRPTRPKYAEIWEVQGVLDAVDSWGPDGNLSLKLLTFRVTMLLALCSPKRVSELAKLSLCSLQRSSQGWKFTFEGMTKNRGTGPAHSAIYERFDENPNLCPISNLESYLERTSEARDLLPNRPVLLSYKQPHNSVTATTVARWLKSVLALSGVDKHFSAHSTRAASTSLASAKGLSSAQILSAADWNPKGSTFQKFYLKEKFVSYQQNILSKGYCFKNAFVNVWSSVL